jgi:hypothetical protein
MPAFSHNDVPRDNKNNLVWERRDGPYGENTTTQTQTPTKKKPTLNYTAKTMREIAEVEDYIIQQGATPEEETLMEEINNLAMEINLDTGSSHTDSLLDMDMNDMDNFEDMCNMKEAYHALLAKSPQGDGHYLYHSDLTGGMVNYHANAAIDARMKQSSLDLEEVDEKNRIMTSVEITVKGSNYIQGTSKFGKVYIDLKFTKYVPSIGDTMNCIIGLNGGGSMPWKCYRIPQ